MAINTPKRPVRDLIRSRRLTTTFALLTTLSVGILAGSVLTHGVSGKEAQAVDTSDARPITIPSPQTLSNGFSAIVKQVGPAVVNINTESLPKQSTAPRGGSGGNGSRRRGVPPGHPNIPNGGGGGEDQQNDMQDLFNRFFGGQGGPGGQDGDDGEGFGGGGERRALGSGFIVDPRGYIITNNHVVDKADKIFVKLSNDPDGGPGDEGHPAKVIGVDKDTDIAVIKIDVKEPLPTVKLGNSEGAQVGDWVLALGSPFSLAKTVTAGIVSAKDRANLEGSAPSQFQKFIQTDAAINPGNSGGPLVDMSGQVIGMNTAIFTSSGSSAGVGFAMPSNIIAGVYNMLIGPEHKVVRGSIGISFQPSVSSAVQRMYGFKNGVIVSTVTKDKGAARAGIQPNDVITTIDGRQVKDGDDMVADISARKIGSTVKLGYLRDGKPYTAAVTIGNRADLSAANSNDDDSDASQAAEAGQGKIGISVAAVPSAMASKSGVKGGVIITAVKPGSFAEEISLQKGMIITAINKKPVVDEASFKAIVNGLKPGEDVVFSTRQPNDPTHGNNFWGGTLP